MLLKCLWKENTEQCAIFIATMPTTKTVIMIQTDQSATAHTLLRTNFMFRDIKYVDERKKRRRRTNRARSNPICASPGPHITSNAKRHIKPFGVLLCLQALQYIHRPYTMCRQKIVCIQSMGHKAQLQAQSICYFRYEKEIEAGQIHKCEPERARETTRARARLCVCAVGKKHSNWLYKRVSRFRLRRVCIVPKFTTNLTSRHFRNRRNYLFDSVNHSMRCLCNVQCVDCGFAKCYAPVLCR